MPELTSKKISLPSSRDCDEEGIEQLYGDCLGLEGELKWVLHGWYLEKCKRDVAR